MDNLNQPSNSNVETLDLLQPDKEEQVVNETPSEELEEISNEEDLLAEPLKKEAKKEKTDDDEEEIDLTDDEEEEQVEEVPLEPIVTPVRIKEITAKYPKIFDDFPYLKVAYYRDKQFTDLLPTVDDARQAVENSKSLEIYKDELNKGNINSILEVVKNANQEAFAKIVDDYLPTLEKLEPNAYYHTVGNIIKRVILGMAQKGNQINNENLKTAALVLNQYMFESNDLPPIENFSKAKPEVDKDKQEFIKQRESFAAEKLNTSVQELQTKVNNSLLSTIDIHIDKDGTMSPYVRKNARMEALNIANGIIAKDKYFQTVMQKLWVTASQDNFSQASMNRIRSTYLSKAKTVLSPVIQKVRSEVLKGQKKQELADEKDKRGPIQGRATPSSNSGKSSTINKGERTLDFLMRD
jgi:hypothetical protein